MLKWRRSETVASLEVLVQTSHHEGLLNNPGLTLNTGALNIFEKLICVVLFEAHTHTHTKTHQPRTATEVDNWEQKEGDLHVHSSR